jgi:hypothetical protein
VGVPPRPSTPHATPFPSPLAEKRSGARDSGRTLRRHDRKSSRKSPGRLSSGGTTGSPILSTRTPAKRRPK